MTSLSLCALSETKMTSDSKVIDDYTKDGGPEKFTGQIQMVSLSLYPQFETSLISNRKVIELLLQLKSAKAHGENYIKVKPGPPSFAQLSIISYNLSVQRLMMETT